MNKSDTQFCQINQNATTCFMIDFCVLLKEVLMHTAQTKDGNPTKNKLLYFGLIDRNYVSLSFKATCNEKENLQRKLEVVVSFLEKL